jgi:hypothetical protein
LFFRAFVLRHFLRQRLFARLAFQNAAQPPDGHGVLLIKSVFFPQNEMNEVTRKDLCPQITQMDADEEFWNRRARRERRKNSAFSAFSCSNQFAVSASIHVHPRFNSFGCGSAALRLGRLPVLRCPPEGFLGRARFREDAKKLLYFYGHELEPMLNSSA